MSFCFQVPSGDLFFLYTSDSDILLQSASPRGFQHQTHLADDYASCLSAAYFEDMIYYSYLSVDGSLILRSISQKPSLCQKKILAENIFPPRLLSFHKELLWLSLIGDNSTSGDVTGQKLSITLPLKQNVEYLLPKTICETSTIALWESPSDLWFLILTDSSQTWYLFCQDFSFQKQSSTDGHALETLSEEKETLRRQLERAKNQYDQLMDVAIQYREEAKKWYERCIKRQGR